MTLLELRYFESICRTGSMTQAAETLHVSQSAISSAIRELEQDLKVTLFTRTSKGLLLTAAGTEFREYTQRILTEVSQAESAMRKLAGQRQLVRLGTTIMIGVTIWPQLFALVQKEMPQLEITNKTGNRDELLNFMNDGELDATIATLAHPEELAAHFEMLKIGQAPPLAFCISKSNPLAGQDPVPVTELLKQPLVRIDSGNMAHIDQLYQKYQMTPHYIDTCDQFSAMLGLIRQNIACGFINVTAVEGIEGIRAIPLANFPAVNYYLIWNKTGSRTPGLKALISILKGAKQ